MTRLQSIEEALRTTEDAAAFLVYVAESAMLNANAPTARALSGLADVLERLTETLAQVRISLPVEALNADLRTKKAVH